MYAGLTLPIRGRLRNAVGDPCDPSDDGRPCVPVQAPIVRAAGKAGCASAQARSRPKGIRRPRQTMRSTSTSRPRRLTPCGANCQCYDFEAARGLAFAMAAPLGVQLAEPSSPSSATGRPITASPRRGPRRTTGSSGVPDLEDRHLRHAALVGGGAERRRRAGVDLLPATSSRRPRVMVWRACSQYDSSAQRDLACDHQRLAERADPKRQIDTLCYRVDVSVVKNKIDLKRRIFG